MKTLVSIIVAAGIAVAFAAPASAGMMKTPMTKASCQKAHMMWDAHMHKCMKGKM